jgi:hypothetical protein
MIPGRNDRESEIEQLFRQLRRDAKPGGRVLPIANNDVDLSLSHQLGNSPGHRTAPRLSKDIANEENLHFAYST